MDFEKNHKILLEKQEELYEKRYKYLDLIKDLEKEIDTYKYKIHKNCIDCFGSHEWVRECEDGIYGEIFYVCKRCECYY